MIYSFWHEFKRYNPAFRLFIAAFTLTAMMMILDWYNNDETLIYNWVTNPQYQELVYDSFQTIEESLKLIAEGVFIATFSVCLNLAKQMSNVVKIQKNLNYINDQSVSKTLQKK